MASTHSEKTFTIPREATKALSKGASAFLLLSVRDNPRCQGSHLSDLLRMLLEKCQVGKNSAYSGPLSIKTARMTVVIVDSLQQYNYILAHEYASDAKVWQDWAKSQGDAFITTNTLHMHKALTAYNEQQVLSGEPDAILAQLNQLGQQEGVLFLRWSDFQAQISDLLSLPKPLFDFTSAFSEKILQELSVNHPSSNESNLVGQGLFSPSFAVNVSEISPHKRVSTYQEFARVVSDRAREYVQSHGKREHHLKEQIENSVRFQIEEYATVAALTGCPDIKHKIFYPGRMIVPKFADNEKNALQFLPGKRIEFSPWVQVNHIPAGSESATKRQRAHSSATPPLSSSPSSSSVESSSPIEMGAYLSSEITHNPKKHVRNGSNGSSSSSDTSPVGSPPRQASPIQLGPRAMNLTPESGSDCDEGGAGESPNPGFSVKVSLDRSLQQNLEGVELSAERTESGSVVITAAFSYKSVTQASSVKQMGIFGTAPVKPAEKLALPENIAKPTPVGH